MINPWYIVSSQDESPSFTIAFQNNTIFVETSVAMHLTLWDMYGRKLEEWAIMEKDNHPVSTGLPAGIYVVVADNGKVRKNC